MSSFRRLHTIVATTAPAVSGTAISATKITPKPQKPTSQAQLALLAEKFKERTNNAAFRFRIPYYESTVNRLAAAKQFSLIEDILEHQKKFKNITNERFTVRLISLYGKAGMFDHARKLFDEMPDLKCVRTVISFNALLSACVDCKIFNELEDLFSELSDGLGIKPDIVSYNTLVKSFCIMGSLESALGLIELMESHGLEPDVITFNMLLDAFYRKKRISDAENVWALMESKSVVANARSYNPKLRALVSDDRISEAVDLIQEMRSKGVMPDIYSFNALIQGYRLEKNLEQVKQWHEELAKCHIPPNRHTYEIMLPFVFDMADFDYAFQLCKDVLNSTHRVNPSVIQRVVDGLAKDYNTAKAKELVDLVNKNKYFRDKLKVPAEIEV